MKGINEVYIGANASGYDDLRWVQTVSRHDFERSTYTQFIDGKGPSPYYYSNDFYKAKKTDVHNRIFDDHPGDLVGDGRDVLWTAELSLIGFRNGHAERVFTIHYGYRIKGMNLYTYYPRAKSNPSMFHLNSLPK